MRTKTWREGILFLLCMTVVRFDAREHSWIGGRSVKAREGFWGPTAEPLKMSFSVSKASLVSDQNINNNN